MNPVEVPVTDRERATSVLRKDIVRVAVQPAFSGLCRGNHRMPVCLRVPGGVSVGRTVTAQSRAAGLAGTQMDPAVTCLYAFVALMAFLMLYGLDSVEVSAG
jgi:hypothetical protein